MSLLRSVLSLFGSRNSSARDRQRVLSLEHLDERIVPALIGGKPVVQNGVLPIKTDYGNDTMTIVDSGSGHVGVVVDGHYFYYRGVSTIDIRDYGGTNTVRYNATSGQVVNALYYNWSGLSSLRGYGNGIDRFTADLRVGLTKDMLIEAG